MNDKWYDDVPCDKQDDLIEWYNVRDISDDEREMLAELYLNGNFWSWYCPVCGEKILAGNPSNWDEFQGVCQSEYVGELCEDCGGMYLRLKEYADC